MKKTVIIIESVIIVVLLVIIYYQYNHNNAGEKIVNKTDTIANKNNPYAKADLQLKIIPSENNTYGYDILIDGKLLIHQPSIPGMPGNAGFKTKEKAQKVGEFVMKKIKNNEMPPTVSIDDLNKLGIMNKE